MQDIKSEINPGRELYQYLVNVVPYQYDQAQEIGASFICKCDSILRESGSMVKLSHESCIAFVLRRLITGASWIKRRCDFLSKGQAEFIRMLREHLANNYLIPADDFEKVVVILVECVNAINRDIAPGMRIRMRQEAVDKGQRCYICGCLLTLEEGARQMAEVEHVWPRALGGASLPHNLRIACSDCNKKKRDHLFSSDYHYEEMCAVVVDRHDPSFGAALSADYRLAVLAYSNYNCSVCGSSPLSVGPLKYARREQGDSWHFMNTQAVCEQHDLEI